MRFSGQLPSNRVEAPEEFCTASAICEMASALEAAGFDACYVTEHPFPPDEWLAGGGHHALDPFVTLSLAAAATERLKLHTNILVLPYRNPFLTAKAVASLDVASGGRVIVGAAAGYLEGEYHALGADFENRNERCDEALQAMKQAWSGAGVHFKGDDFEAVGNTMLPLPVQQPHPPIWIGGNTRRAMRRVVAHGQGWSPFPVTSRYAGRTRTAALESVADLASGIRELQELVQQAGRNEPLDVNFVPWSRGMNPREPLDAARLRDEVQELADAGVTWLSVGVSCRTRAGFLDEVARFGEEVIAKLGVEA